MPKSTGILTLVPTPIDDNSPLEPVALKLLKDAVTTNKEFSVIAVEEAKACRKRWLHWGLDRSAIKNFYLYNEHQNDQSSQELLQLLKQGKNIFLLSDCGLPAFCDPGQMLVDLCHKSHIKVTSTPFANSVALCIALSGFAHNKFVFAGFLAQKQQQREKELRDVLKDKRTIVLMDTPYRLERLLKDLLKFNTKNRDVFIGIDLNSSNEELYRGQVAQIIKKISNFKREFVLIIAPI